MIHQIVNKILIIGKKKLWLIQRSKEQIFVDNVIVVSVVGNFAFKWGMHPGNLQMLQTSAIMRPLPLGYRRGGGAELTPPPPGQVHDQHVQTLVQLGFGRRFLFIMIMNQL